ncbi:MAG: DNA replication and repair protein RecF [Patescibacteria group bacterium]
MMLQSIVLQNFRSYSKKTFAFSPTTTVIVGPNTAGKTNILEAIAFLATGKSFRADQDREAIRWGEELARVRARISNFQFPISNEEKDKEELEIVITQGEVQGARASALTAVRRGWPMKKYLVNGVARRMVDFVGNLRAVLFWPEHLELVTDSPSIRRKYLDSVLVQVDREYRRNLSSYERGLRQRNRLLDLINEGKAGRGQLLFWNQLLIKAGGYITQKREEYIHFVNQYPMTLPRRQAGNAQYQIEYDKSVISESRLEQYKDEEVGAKATLVGPHRDDFIIAKYPIIQLSPAKRDLAPRDNNPNEANRSRELSKYGSRGEQRLAVLWMKLAELDYIEKECGERPILLLDDIFSELDEGHRRLVVDLVGKQQTILTSADEESIPKKIFESATVIRL